MNYAEIRECDIANGIGYRVSLFVSGCTINCDGCFNKEAQNFSYGLPFTEDTTQMILEMLSPEYIRGLSVLGGEPFEPQNVFAICKLLKEVRAKYPHKDIWVFTGRTFEQLICGDTEHAGVIMDVLKCADVIVDGPFVKELRDLSLRFRGSSNQRIIDVRRSLEDGCARILI